MSQTRVLLTGATGYIGGSVLATLKKSEHENIQNAQIDVLIRGEGRRALFDPFGVQVIPFQSLDETDFIRKLSSDYNVIINTASAFHTESAKAMIEGLSDRQSKTGQKTHFIHTSGTSSIGDYPISPTYIEPNELQDDSNIYEYQSSREAHSTYKQRTTDLAVFNTGLETNIKTTIIMAPTIFGKGTGPANNLSIQIPALIRRSLEYKQAVVINDGAGEWDHIHISDLTSLFEIVLFKVRTGEHVPDGKEGLLFAETGRHTWLDISKDIASVGKELKVLDSEGVHNVSLDEATAWSVNGNVQVRELGFASNARSKAIRGRALGWTPLREGEWKNAVEEDFRAILKEENER
ncbi:hypothetical protein N7508_006154 [Penicillium antarcticum]|uniref:uncharacterized protein n=1 Tax=Penicillium antarcticum TaxID=416450 RepID=UPI00238E4E3F|nr:uncharacterized protein N7508_006154 [Penicillium antarcticum]KAJ5301291.1 hypothetical protein N7508_006154 [Penicillium antarcticum]